MKCLLYLVISFVITAPGFAQDSIRYRVIFMGDAVPFALANGMNKEQQEILRHAAAAILEHKTTVFYLDENKYLQGKIPAVSKESKTAQNNLRLQYEMMRDRGARIYFISANQEFNKMGTEGLEKIKRQAPLQKEEADSLLKMTPGNACPDPVEMNLTDSLTIIVFNSEWWLYPFDNANVEEECECKTKSEVMARLDELRYKNRHKFILFASHHPFQSNSIRGSRATLKDHLFPLTAANKNLYVPLPVAGSLYRFFRSAFAKPDNNTHPLYKDMVASIDDIVDSQPNLVYLASHEKGLQFIKEKRIQLIIGAGAKNSRTVKEKNSLFTNTKPGYVTADILHNNNLRITFYTYSDTLQEAFTYSLPFSRMVTEDTISEKNISGDSILVQVHPSYNKTGKLRRIFFGENYRKEWAAATKLPVIRLSKIHGGLIPLQRGGGMQSKSLRLADKKGREWIIRSVEKSPDALLPEGFRQTFARDLLDDATSAQHPFSALVVPPIANSAGLPYASPVIGVIAPDKNLDLHERTFSNMVVLMEEREPLGTSDNTAKMKKELLQDNDNSIDAKEFLNARMLDMLLGDWDRHEDQWRWKDNSKGKNKKYTGVPRDRDQVFHLTQGIIPRFASSDYILPTLRNFDYDIEDVKWVLFKTRFVNAYPEFQISHDAWKKQAEQFKQAITDSVLETALKRLPQTAYDLRHDVLFKKLKSRRDKIPSAMDKYYRFIQKIADIQTSNKNEWVQITDAPNGGLNIRISKLNKEAEVKEELMNKTYDPALTKEIRLYIRNGHDSVVLNNKASGIKLRIIGGNDKKYYQIISSKNQVNIYDKQNGSTFDGDTSQIKKHISNDSMHTVFVPVNLYNVWMPLTLIGLNLDDGFILGTGFKFIKQEGFRKFPYVATHQLLAAYSFSTGAYRIRYNGEWIQALGKADFILQAVANAPNNTINFFGRGNETVFNKTGDYKSFYRTRFSTYQFHPAFRWRYNNASAISIGPSLYYYAFDEDENDGRFITNTSLIGSYDSSTIEKDKFHLGIAMHYTRDTRNNKIVTQWGSLINIRLQVYEGIGKYAKSFAQLIPEIALYKSLAKRSSLVLAERIGGVVGFGQAAFYQSAFIGGHENLYGYRQYRFAGRHSVYNNLELRIKLADIASYIVPGQFGITGFWDIGRVWEKNDSSGKWHNGTGAGIYFAPASVIAVSFVMGYSEEGWYPYFTLGLRF
ncbi:MAG: BamA/TamA family outer membrane protein [Chitinophagaceae bacterium]